MRHCIGSVNSKALKKDYFSRLALPPCGGITAAFRRLGAAGRRKNTRSEAFLRFHFPDLVAIPRRLVKLKRMRRLFHTAFQISQVAFRTVLLLRLPDNLRDDIFGRFPFFNAFANLFPDGLRRDPVFLIVAALNFTPPAVFMARVILSPYMMTFPRT